MKKAIFTLAFIVGIAFMLQAQFEIKPTIGFNFSKLSTEPEGFDQSARVGYQLGGSIQFGKKLYFEPGIFWTKMGSEMVHADQSDIKFTTDINGIRIPVFVGYQIIGGDDENIFGLRIFGGPSMSWITSIEGNDTKLEKDDFNSLLWGVDVGAGIDVWLLFLDIGYEIGLNPVFKDDPDFPDESNDGKNNAFWFNLGMRFRF
ncbi:MAG: hypothetical protein DRJ05_09325 [Bacteroidetes bacterium]|nr:MAG: hypothetical protein DRJ05_09325 [Bacteroidota bacterium]